MANQAIPWNTDGDCTAESETQSKEVLMMIVWRESAKELGKFVVTEQRGSLGRRIEIPAA